MIPIPYLSKQSNVSVVRNRPLSSSSNPFSDAVSNDSNSTTSRLSPNPFNPFTSPNTSNPSLPTPPTVPTPPLPCYTPPPPIPPPRPSSRECPPIPPRNDLTRESAKTPTESAPPLPRRRTILPENRYQSFDAISKQSVDPFSPNPAFSSLNNCLSTNIKTPSEDFAFPAPPLPNPQRKVSSNPPNGPNPVTQVTTPTVVPPQPMARKTSNSALKTSSNWDPFNCSFVDMQLSSLNSDTDSQKMAESQQFLNRVVPSDSSLFNSSVFVSNALESKDSRLMSEDLPNINYRYQSFGESFDKASDGSENPSRESLFPGFSSDFSHFSDPKPSKAELGLNLSASNSGNNLKFMADFSDQSLFNANSSNSSVVSSDPKEDHISPPERNIFIQKSDPFADDFFAQWESL